MSPKEIAISKINFGANSYWTSSRSYSNRISKKRGGSPLSKDSASTLGMAGKNKIDNNVSLKEPNSKFKQNSINAISNDHSIVINSKDQSKSTQHNAITSTKRTSNANSPVEERDENILSTDLSHHYRVKFSTRNDAHYEYLSLSTLGPVYSEKNPVTKKYDYFIGNFENLEDDKK